MTLMRPIPPHRNTSGSGDARRSVLLVVAALAALSLIVVGCSGNGPSKAKSSTSSTERSTTSSSSDTGTGSDTGSGSDSSTGPFSDFTDSSMLSDFGNGDPSSLRRVFLNSCERSGGTVSLCECVAGKLDFNDPSSLIRGAADAARECVTSGDH